MTELSPAARSQLTITGILRAALNLSNFLLISEYKAGSVARGIVPDLARELARRLGVEVEFIGYDSPGKVADAAKTGAWDVAFLGAEPARASEIDFTAAYLEIEATYLVPPGSSISKPEDVDQKGIRISVSGRSAYDLYLARTLKNAELVRVEGIEASWQQFLAGGFDALAGLRPRLVADAEKMLGSRVLEGRFTAIQQAIGTPKGRPDAAGYLRAFAEEAKSSGMVAAAIERHGVRGVTVAALAQ
jgi:polar amino acid transport system substrate-binding protein